MENATTWILNHRKRILTNISSVAMLIVIFALFGAFDFMTMSFDFAKLGEMAYWSHIFARVVGLICAFNIAVNMFQPYAENRNTELQRDIIRHDSLSKMRSKSFEGFIHREYNPAEKKKAWVAHINKRINILGRFAKDRSRMLWGDDRTEFAEMRKKDGYCRKRAVLESMKDEAWIERNIDTISVRGYRAIDPSSFDLSIDGKAGYSQRKVTSNTVTARALKTSSMILGTVLIGMLSTIWSLEISQAVIDGSKEEVVQSVISFLLDIGFLAGKFVNGMLYSDKLVENEIHKAYVDRIAILREYFSSDMSPIADFAQEMRAIDERADAECRTVREKARRKAEEREKQRIESAVSAEQTRNGGLY